MLQKNVFNIKQLFKLKEKMFPFFNAQPNIYQGSQFNTYMNPSIDLSYTYGSLANYYLILNSPYLQSNLGYNGFSQSTLYSDNKTECYQLFKEGNDKKFEQTKIDQISSPQKKQNKIEASDIKRYKTKIIHRKERQIINSQRERQEKAKKNQTQLKYKEQQYSDEDQTNRKRTTEQENLNLKYRRKNTQSNIVNRIYSFLTTQFKNKKQVFRLGITQEKKLSYLKYMQLVFDAWKGPVKRHLLLNLLNISQTLPAYNLLEKTFKNEKKLSLEQFEYLNRVLIRLYLTKIATVSVITSKKMKKGVWREHLEKIRQLNEYFFQSQKHQD